MMVIYSNNDTVSYPF